MMKNIIIVFVILFAANCCFSQSNNYFQKIALKLSEKKSNGYAFTNAGNSIWNENRISLINKSGLETKHDLLYKSKISAATIRSLTDSKLNKKYPIWIPITEVIGLNFGIGAFNTYVTKSQFAKISFKTIKKNFETGFVWDHDHFITNFFAHPYHGNLYFNTARSNGYSFFESAPFSFGGSLMWELFMENEPASTNDLISTTVSGIFLGESLYRFSSLIIDESKTGFERVMLEIGAGILNPFRAFNRLLQGKTSRVTNEKAYEIEPLSINLSYGINRQLVSGGLFSGVSNGVLDVNLVYGNPFKVKKRKPYDIIRMRGTFNFGAGQSRIGIVTAFANLAAKNSGTSMLKGIFQQYDFFDNLNYKFGGVGFGGGLINNFQLGKKTNILTVAHLNIMPLGAANSEYSAFGEKEYNFSSGFNTKLEAALNWGWGNVLVNYNFYWLHTVIGAESDEFVGYIKPRLLIHLFSTFGVGVEYSFYHRMGYYKDFPDINRRVSEAKAFLNFDIQAFEDLLTK